MSADDAKSLPDPTPGVAPHGAPAHVSEHDLGFELPPPAKLTAARGVAIAVVAAVLVGGAFTVGYLPRRHARAALAQGAQTVQHTTPRVDVVTPHLGASDRALALPGSVHPLEETVIYSRANGYLRRWLFDIGDRVREGQLLAEIETPEVDQDLLQARAQLSQAEAGVGLAAANHEFARTDLERYRQLAPSGYASRQDLDQRQASAGVAQANVEVARAAVGAARANVQRLVQLKSFGRVTAPFNGTLTARMVDRGALVTAGNATPLFRVTATDPVRVFVQVPQDVAPSIHDGVQTRVTVREYPGQVFPGTISRSAGALDAASRTMETEIRVPNGDGRLITGMYADVAFALPLPHRVFEVPATALVSDSRGQRVAVVGDDGLIHLVAIVVERDTGPALQISSGLTGRERVVRIASAALVEGTHVEAVVAPPTPTAAGPGAGH